MDSRAVSYLNSSRGPMTQYRLTLTVMPQPLSICRLSPHEPCPAWALGDGFCSATRTADELSIVCGSSAVPRDVNRSDGWRALRVHGKFSFDECGILAAVTTPLAEAGIPILAICTFDTDYILVKELNLEAATRALIAAGLGVEATPSA